MAGALKRVIVDIEHEVMPLRVSDLQRLINRRLSHSPAENETDRRYSIPPQPDGETYTFQQVLNIIVVEL